MIYQNHTAIGFGNRTIFQANFGEGPYTYEIDPRNTINGSIDENGVYTAPRKGKGGVETIIVTDSNGVKKTATIGVMSVYQLVCDIIQKEMDMPNGSVFLYNQKITIPKGQDMVISLQILDSKIVSNSLKTIDGIDVQSVNKRAVLQIDLWSRSMEAVNRKEEIVMALASRYAESQMENCAFKIGKIPSNFVNLSSEEGSAIPYRFNISIPIQYYVEKRKEISFYENFENVNIITNQ